MNPLALVPARVWECALVALACSLIAWGFIHHERQIGAARAQTQLQHERAAVAQAGASATAQAASETERRINHIQEVVYATQVSASAVAADASAARAQRDAAVVQLHAYVRRSAMPASTPAAAGTAPVSDPDVLLAGLLDESWQRNLDLAGEADKRRERGLGCERGYDALTPTPSASASPAARP